MYTYYNETTKSFQSFPSYQQAIEAIEKEVETDSNVYRVNISRWLPFKSRFQLKAKCTLQWTRIHPETHTAEIIERHMTCEDAIKLETDATYTAWDGEKYHPLQQPTW